jgi:hypothetical protein
LHIGKNPDSPPGILVLHTQPDEAHQAGRRSPPPAAAVPAGAGGGRYSNTVVVTELFRFQAV